MFSPVFDLMFQQDQFVSNSLIAWKPVEQLWGVLSQEHFCCRYSSHYLNDIIYNLM